MRNLLWHQMRADAKQFDCEDCGKAPGELCINLWTGEELECQAAHVKRLRAAGYGSMMPA